MTMVALASVSCVYSSPCFDYFLIDGDRNTFLCAKAQFYDTIEMDTMSFFPLAQ